MIIKNAKHFFTATLPALEEHEKEIFYNHPVYDLKCNQLGMLYPGPGIKYFGYSPIGDKYILTTTDNYRNSIMTNSLIYQCYSGIINQARRKIYPLDGNLLNKTIENLVYPGYLKPTAIENYNFFVSNTVNYMLSVDVKLKNKKIDPQIYWGIQKLIPDIKNAYTKASKVKIKYDGSGALKTDDGLRVGEVKVKTRSFLSKEELDSRTIYTLKAKEEGQTDAQIAKTFGVDNTNVQFYKRRKLFHKK